MNTGSFSCFVYQSLNFCVPEHSPTCFPRHFSIFISKLHEYRYPPAFGLHHLDKVKKEQEQQGHFGAGSNIQSYCDRNILAPTVEPCNIVSSPKNYGNYIDWNKHNNNITTLESTT
ncbi:hypothetical protein JHK87_040313 [Glycine soja]|nr:hypothetical protein JHK87_040313 [Glycine soja]